MVLEELAYSPYSMSPYLDNAHSNPCTVWLKLTELCFLCPLKDSYIQTVSSALLSLKNCLLLFVQEEVKP